MKNKRSLWVSLLSVVAIAVIALTAILASGWSPKLGLDLDGGPVGRLPDPHLGQPGPARHHRHHPQRPGQRRGQRCHGGQSGQEPDLGADPRREEHPADPRDPGQYRPAAVPARALLRAGVHRGQGEAALDRAAAHLFVHHPIDRGQPPGHARLEQRQRLHQQHQHPEDPAFATFKSTSPLSDSKTDTVLLPGTAQNGCWPRYVLGPAQMTGTAVKSASAQLNNGQWAVNLVLTGPGSTQWDTLAKQQFHAIIAIDLDGQVISAPITQPTQESFTPFNGQVQISGGFTEDQAKTLATEFTYGALPGQTGPSHRRDRLAHPGQGLPPRRPHLRVGRPAPRAAVRHLLLPVAGGGGGGRPGRDRGLPVGDHLDIGPGLQHHHRPGRRHRHHRVDRYHRRLLHRLLRTIERRGAVRTDHPEQRGQGVRQRRSAPCWPPTPSPCWAR